MKVLYLLGDSTCAIKKSDARPETGWGEVFSEFIASGWVIDNRALNGRSTKSFIDEGIFNSVLESAKAGDSAIIQFGHNDSKPDKERFSEPYKGYVDNLVFMANKLREKEVSVYFVTSIARRQFNDRGIIRQTHGEYIHAMHYAAFKANVPCVDATTATMVELQAMGDKRSKDLFMNFGQGLYDNYPYGKEDNTHLRPLGARWVALLIARELSLLYPRPEFLSQEIQNQNISDDFTSIEIVD